MYLLDTCLLDVICNYIYLLDKLCRHLLESNFFRMCLNIYLRTSHSVGFSRYFISPQRTTLFHCCNGNISASQFRKPRNRTEWPAWETQLVGEAAVPGLQAQALGLPAAWPICLGNTYESCLPGSMAGIIRGVSTGETLALSLGAVCAGDVAPGLPGLEGQELACWGPRGQLCSDRCKAGTHRGLLPPCAPHWGFLQTTCHDSPAFNQEDSGQACCWPVATPLPFRGRVGSWTLLPVLAFVTWVCVFIQMPLLISGFMTPV